MGDAWLKLAKKYRPDVDHGKRTKSPLPEDFPPVLLELVETAHRILEELKKDSDYLDDEYKDDSDYLDDSDSEYLDEGFPFTFLCPDVMSYTFLQWLYAKKFPGKSVEDAVSVFLETQPALFKARKEELARKMAECDAALASSFVEVVEVVANKKRKTQE